MRAVLDASAYVDSAFTAVDHGVATIEAPMIIDLEVTSTARRMERAGELDEAEATDAIAAWLRLDLKRHRLTRLTPRAWAMRHTITSSDAYYVALAVALDLPLVTQDRRLARAATRYCDVIVPA